MSYNKIRFFTKAKVASCIDPYHYSNRFIKFLAENISTLDLDLSKEFKEKPLYPLNKKENINNLNIK